MNLSNDTVNVLKNFATINPNLVFQPGQKLKTISESKTILASATIVEDFPQEFGVYDLNEFLSVLNLIDQPTLQFEDKSVLIQGSGQKIRYFFLKAISLPLLKKKFRCVIQSLESISKKIN